MAAFGFKIKKFTAAMFAVYHGPNGLQNIGTRVHTAALVLAKGLRDGGNTIENPVFFDTLRINPAMAQSEIRHRSTIKVGYNFFLPPSRPSNKSFHKKTFMH